MLSFFNRRSFTLLETLIAVVVVTIVAAIAVSSFQGYRDQVAMLVDETNQKILAAAVKIAAANSGTVAGGVAELPPEDLQKAYALVTGGKRPYTMLAYLQQVFEETLGHPVAEADSFLPSQYYNKNLKTIICPKDPTPPTGFDANGRPTGGKSYGIHSQARGKPLAWLLDPNNAKLALIIETDDTGDSREFRHKRNGQMVQVETSVRGKHGFRPVGVGAGTSAEEVDEKD